MARLVLLDTNALLMPFQFRLNLEAELGRLLGAADIRVPTPVLEELKAMEPGNRRARAAVQLASRFRTIEDRGSADDALLDLATSLGAVVVTNDAALRARLRAARVPVAFLRARNHLVVEGL